MTAVTIKFEGSDLSSRSAAAIQRHKIAKQISLDYHIVIDLSNVLSISHSYADELFGVLVEVYGVDKLLANIEFTQASEHILQNIASVIYLRLKETGQPIPKSA